MSHRKGRKRKFESKLDEIIQQDSQEFMDSQESSSKSMNLGDVTIKVAEVAPQTSKSQKEREPQMKTDKGELYL